MAMQFPIWLAVNIIQISNLIKYDAKIQYKVK